MEKGHLSMVRLHGPWRKPALTNQGQFALMEDLPKPTISGICLPVLIKAKPRFIPQLNIPKETMFETEDSVVHYEML